MNVQVKVAEHIRTGHKVAIKILNRKKIKQMEMEEKGAGPISGGERLPSVGALVQPWQAPRQLRAHVRRVSLQSAARSRSCGCSCTLTSSDCTR